MAGEEYPAAAECAGPKVELPSRSGRPRDPATNRPGRSPVGQPSTREHAIHEVIALVLLCDQWARREAIMRLTWRDVLATVFVVAAVAGYLLWLAGLEVFGIER